MFTTIIGAAQALSAVLAVFMVAVRVVESIHELRKNPDLDTLGEIIQVVKNFFTIETYKQRGAK